MMDPLVAVGTLAPRLPIGAVVLGGGLDPNYWLPCDGVSVTKNAQTVAALGNAFPKMTMLTRPMGGAYYAAVAVGSKLLISPVSPASPMRYTTDGVTWNTSTSPTSTRTLRRMVCPDGVTVYALANQESVTNYVYKSVDGGATWPYTGTVGGFDSISDVSMDASASGTVIMALNNSSDGTVRIYRATGAGLTFNAISGSRVMDNTTALIVTSVGGNVWVVSSGAYKYVSVDDGVTWTATNFGAAGNTTIVKFGSYYIAHGSNTPFYSTNPITGWVVMPAALYGFVIANGRLLGYGSYGLYDASAITSMTQLITASGVSYPGNIGYANGVYFYTTAGVVYWSTDEFTTVNKSLFPNVQYYPQTTPMPWGLATAYPQVNGNLFVATLDKTSVSPPALGDVYLPGNGNAGVLQPALKWYMRIA